VLDVREISQVLQTGAKAIQLLVLVVLALLVVRTWFVLGLVEPVTVSGSSMAPTLRGPSVTAACDRCKKQFAVGAEFAVRTYFTDCPHCGEPRVSLDGLPLNRSDMLWIDRTAFLRRSPRRWEPVVFLSPEEGGQLVVKRVVGLPGEHVALDQGDLIIDGQRVAKSLTEQRELRHLVHREREPGLRWQSASNEWQWHGDAWRYADLSGGIEKANEWRWLHYRHSQQTIFDDAAYNAGLTQQLAEVNDLFFSAMVQVGAPARLALRINDGQHQVQVGIDSTGGRLRLGDSSRRIAVEIPPKILKRLAAGGVLWEVSTFDRHVLMALDNVTLLCQELPDSARSFEPLVSLAVGVMGGDVVLQETTIYRDTHYLAGNETGKFPGAEVQLRANDYYLLGDNVPVSVDSRHWGALPGHYLIGKPFRLPLRSEERSR